MSGRLGLYGRRVRQHCSLRSAGTLRGEQRADSRLPAASLSCLRYTWGFCGYASWPVRQDHTASIDPNGFIYVSGGTSYPVSSGSGYSTLADAWVSSASFANTSFVSAQCTLDGAPLPIPATLGLQNFPAVLNSNPYTTNALGIVTVNTTTNICSGNGAVQTTAANSAVVVIALTVAAVDGHADVRRKGEQEDARAK